MWKNPPQDSAGGTLRFLSQCEEVLSAHAARLAGNPFADASPIAVQLTPQGHGESGRLWLRDETGSALPVIESFPLRWELLACSGGQALPLR